MPSYLGSENWHCNTNVVLISHVKRKMESWLVLQNICTPSSITSYHIISTTNLIRLKIHTFGGKTCSHYWNLSLRHWKNVTKCIYMDFGELNNRSDKDHRCALTEPLTKCAVWKSMLWSISMRLEWGKRLYVDVWLSCTSYSKWNPRLPQPCH